MLGLYDSYVYSASELKRNIIEKNAYMFLFLLFDIIGQIVNGVYYEPNFYVIPATLMGIIGVWKFRYNFLVFYQVSNYASLCLKIYTIYLTNVLYLWVFVVVNFYTMYKYWFYIFEIKMLNENDIIHLRNGWNPFFYDKI